VRTLDSELATAILHEYPTAKAFSGISVKRLANLRYDGRHLVGLDLAKALAEAAKVSVGHHHGEAYRIQAKYACEDIDLLRRRIRDLDRDIEAKLKDHEVGTLLTTIDGIGPLTSARLIAAFGNPADYKSAGALASFVGVVPATNKSGKRQGDRAGITPIGDADLRCALWMPTLTAVRRNAWLKAFYDRLIAAGKLPKVALVAAMNKLLHPVYSVAKNRKPFEPRLLPQGAHP
jgi:transposase